MIAKIKSKWVRRPLAVMAFVVAVPFALVAAVSDVVYGASSYALEASPKAGLKHALTEAAGLARDHLDGLRSAWHGA